MFYKVIISIFLITSSISPVFNPAEAINPSAGIHVQNDCELVLEPLVEGNLPLEQLINPILTSQSELNQQVELFTEMYNCLAKGAAPSLEGREAIRTYLQYFLIFADGLDTPVAESTLDLVLLETSSDPGVAKIRDEAEIQAPQGYVFLRYYDSRESMPQLVRRAFETPEVAGVTVLSRYIAILAEEKKTWPQRLLQLQTLPEITSHELIHAYVNSTLLPLEYDLPAWFSEGLAIYFSGSAKNHTVVTPNFSIRNTSTEDYQLYDTVFKYLEARHGRERLLELINLSIQEANPTILYRDLNIKDDQQMVAQVRTWSRHRNNLARSGIIGVALIAVLLLWRLAPEYNCQNCGHTGKKRDLIDGVYCPNCKRPYDRVVRW